MMKGVRQVRNVDQNLNLSITCFHYQFKYKISLQKIAFSNVIALYYLKQMTVIKNSWKNFTDNNCAYFNIILF